jgi:hypothetical protein
MLLITEEVLNFAKSKWDINPETGEVLWNDTHRFKEFRGKQVGHKYTCHRGRTEFRTRVGSKIYSLARILYAIYYGKDPIGYEVEHLDGNSLNNAKSNLTLKTGAENKLNKGNYKNNTSGMQGIYPFKGGWKAQIGSGKNRKGNTFPTKEQAIAFRTYWLEQMGYNSARSRRK